MSDEFPRRRKLTQLVPDHVFGDIDARERLPIVHEERVANEIRNDQAATRPSLDWLLIIRVALLIDLGQKLVVNERTFLE